MASLHGIAVRLRPATRRRPPAGGDPPDPEILGRWLGGDDLVAAAMRRDERGPDGTWRDGLLMDLLADELTG